MPYLDGLYYADGSTAMMLSQISYDEMHSAGDVIQDVERNIPIKVASSTERHDKYPTPNDGDAVWRTDIGVEQRYSATTPVGWFSATTGLMNVKPSGVVFGGSGSGSISESGLISFTNVTNIYVNGIFGPSFKNYKILFNLQNMSASGNIYMYYSSEGVADSSANYYRTNFYTNTTTISTSYVPNEARQYVIWSAATGRSGLADVTLYNPYLGRPIFDCTSVTSGPAIAPSVYRESVYFNSATASFDGFQMIHSTSGTTLTGSMLVYGFN